MMASKIFALLMAMPCMTAAVFRNTPTKVSKAPAVPKTLSGTSANHAAATNATATSMTYVALGPFEDHAAACKYCYQSHTRSSVVKNCICTAYTGDDGPTMFCTASKPGVAYSSAKDGACKCIEKDMQQMGKTTCVPWNS